MTRKMPRDPEMAEAVLGALLPPSNLAQGMEATTTNSEHFEASISELQSLSLRDPACADALVNRDEDIASVHAMVTRPFHAERR